MTPRFSIQRILGLVLLTQSLSVPAEAADAPREAAPANGRAAGAASDAGLLELLEFIGEFTTEDGEWVDPDSLLETDSAELADAPRRGPAQPDGDESAAGNCGTPPCE